jgi:hypothetical protein
MAEKQTKGEVHYTPHAENHSTRCVLCRFFIAADGECRRVAGAISPSGWCELFGRKPQEDKKMTTPRTDDLDVLRQRDAQAKRDRALHPSSRRLYDQEAGAKPSPESTLAQRHSLERGEQQDRHHRATQALLAQQQSTRNRRLQTSHPLAPADDDKAAQEFTELNAKNRRERRELEYKHLVEKDRLRAVK